MLTNKFLIVFCLMVVVIPLVILGDDAFASDVNVGSTNTTEVINGVTVPPEPDPTLNNATIAGIDSNGDSIRDDVERVLAKEFGGDKTKYAEARKFAIAEQNLLVRADDGAVKSYLVMIECTTLHYKDSDKLTHALANTVERSRIYGRLLAGSITGACGYSAN